MFDHPVECCTYTWVCCAYSEVWSRSIRSSVLVSSRFTNKLKVNVINCRSSTFHRVLQDLNSFAIILRLRLVVLLFKEANSFKVWNRMTCPDCLYLLNSAWHIFVNRWTNSDFIFSLCPHQYWHLLACRISNHLRSSFFTGELSTDLVKDYFHEPSFIFCASIGLLGELVILSLTGGYSTETDDCDSLFKMFCSLYLGMVYFALEFSNISPGKRCVFWMMLYLSWKPKYGWMTKELACSFLFFRIEA